MNATRTLSIAMAFTLCVSLWTDARNGERLGVRAIDIVNEDGAVVMTLEGDKLGASLKMRAAPFGEQAAQGVPWGVELSATELTHSSLVLSGWKPHGRQSRVALGVYGEPQTPWMSMTDHKGIKRVVVSPQVLPPTLSVRGPSGKVTLETNE